ncbi:type VII toxin-antitoxin system MntA family adenylyltransferase antitoxin [Clostridium tetani]|uniref:Polymerase beta nucleotidyltransferase domain-containing protein n=1 Tax=Clostridium tetani TaxID=1513 RepID=A0ABC8EA00_CLOTA|nr:nucleotidyltransferase domain-containing protein [Clostridium tetani]RXI64773.1 nucleotidyltransferase domain-containing protein [Clostridium tetani]RXI74927.1 nucleotidyltransferase domain-containing protein [Clostridium tetani]RXM59028.1 nucleotidyltransferase domain-containing protein [Clostridium tetani]RXM77669.1 nucleotidyltransferase domain-containing protein [Clostridium tetani]RYU99675.1 nucleotidyltransferase domain-containing protein [Clostridium tetani]
MLQNNLKEVIDILDNNIEKLVEDYGIKLLYIFGSYAKGKNNKNSDLDIAVLLDENYNPMDKLRLIGDLTLIFKRDDIDLVILNSASPVLRHQIIKYGKLVYMEREETKVFFEVKVLNVYMDMEPFRRTQMKYINEWIEKNSRGDN